MRDKIREAYIAEVDIDKFSLKDKLISCAKETINEIAKIALEENNTIVCEFLSQNADKIINKVFKAKK